MARTKQAISKLQAWREKHGFTQRDVSGLGGISCGMVSMLETGKRRLKPQGMVLLARRLGAQVEDLFVPE